MMSKGKRKLINFRFLTYKNLLTIELKSIILYNTIKLHSKASNHAKSCPNLMQPNQWLLRTKT